MCPSASMLSHTWQNTWNFSVLVSAVPLQHSRMAVSYTHLTLPTKRIVSMMREILQQQTSSESVLLPAQQGEGAVMITSVTKQTSAQGNDRQDHS